MSVTKVAEIWNKRTANELRNLAHIKRFLECLTGDSAFRQELASEISAPTAVAKRYGIDVDPALMLPLFHSEFMQYRHDKDDDRWPLAHLWDAYLSEMLALRTTLISAGDTTTINPQFHTWRRRQIARAQSELGESGAGIVHPIICYELSKGCTIGCWFCGISAAKFGGYYPFTRENEQNWREILQFIVGRFGTAAQTGFCYWATDPNDNPDYIKFLRVHHEITGIIPQTTTAAPLKDIGKTRELLKLFDEHRHIVNRFSILSVGQLRRVHQTFTPEELLGVELVLQHASAFTSKARAGRAYTSKSGAEESCDEEMVSSALGKQPASEPPGTIACVSGFVVNLIEGRVRLISPTPARSRWPDGYRIHGEALFRNSAEFAKAIDSLIERHMPPTLTGSYRLSFRRDLSFEAKQEGFALVKAGAEIACEGPQWVQEVGKLIYLSNKTVTDTIVALASNGTSPFLTMHCLDDLYKAGVLDDEQAPWIFEQSTQHLSTNYISDGGC